VTPRRILLGTCAISVIIVTPCFLALTTLFPLISPWFLRFQYARPDMPPSVRFSADERQTFAEATAHYLVSSKEIDYLADLRDDEGLPLFNERELTHMVDVKVLVGRAARLDIVLGLLLAASLTILSSQPQSRRRIPFYLVVASVVAPALGITALIVVPLQFRWFLVEFHHVFFVGDSWLFPRSDTLIQLFPEQFWFDGLQAWLLLVIGTSVLIGVGAYVWLRRMPASSS
jgi:integral membrane protein (TIGR01906 family)